MAVGMNLANAPVGDVDDDVVVLGSVEKLLGERSLPGKPGDHPDDDVRDLAFLDSVDDVGEFVPVSTGSARLLLEDLDVADGQIVLVEPLTDVVGRRNPGRVSYLKFGFLREREMRVTPEER